MCACCVECPDRSNIDSHQATAQAQAGFPPAFLQMKYHHAVPASSMMYGNTHTYTTPSYREEGISARMHAWEATSVQFPAYLHQLRAHLQACYTHMLVHIPVWACTMGSRIISRRCTRQLFWYARFLLWACKDCFLFLGAEAKALMPALLCFSTV